VRIPSLNDVSKSKSEIVNSNEIINNEIIKIIIARKYLLMSDLIVFESNNETLFK
tara:strand:- start:321 stop:485 length:165 start_codon:yes stop_codon:yes gene_type:complete